MVPLHSKIHHFADDTNTLYTSKSLKDINRKVNYNLRQIVEWLRANKIEIQAKQNLFFLDLKTKKYKKYEI